MAVCRPQPAPRAASWARERGRQRVLDKVGEVVREARVRAVDGKGQHARGVDGLADPLHLEEAEAARAARVRLDPLVVGLPEPGRAAELLPVQAFAERMYF